MKKANVKELDYVEKEEIEKAIKYLTNNILK